jgi:aminoglycoside 6'-N-acetyltransferase I
MRIRPLQSDDCREVSYMRAALWPDGSVEEHARELEEILAGAWSATYPYVVLVAETDDGRLIGFADVTMRSRADGCDPKRAVGYLEGWFVVEDQRRRGIGAALMQAAEEWARTQGCVEMASDTWITNEASQRAHEALGFEAVDRVVTYRKRLA